MKAIQADYELAEGEEALLRQAGLTLDLCEALQVELDQAGPLIDSPQGLRAHPAGVELRQQRIVLARLIVALRVPLDEDDVGGSGRRLQSCPIRGVHRMGS